MKRDFVYIGFKSFIIVLVAFLDFVNNNHACNIWLIEAFPNDGNKQVNICQIFRSKIGVLLVIFLN